ncbi:hypothetical protein BKA93DRAFT_739387 [Sparassis latifolia]
MSRQDKATTERHAKTLRELLKKPENKVCADCKRNDPRWASWNIGVFLCIRCSGIHRSMGTHISKVKSVDLDVWTPEQMASIQRWGNRLANLYWEAHLKPGHIPADHKMESFIRSKYESRRWALDGPAPSDPSVLETQAAQSTQSTQAAPAVTAPSAPSSGSPSVTPSVASAPRPSVTNRQPQPHQLLSAGIANRTQQAATQAALSTPDTQPQQPAASASVPQATPANELFSLDFHPPSESSTPTAAPAKKDVKQDILSLFSTPAPTPAQPAFPQFAQADAGWGNFASQASPQPQPQQTSMMGNAGVAMWGASSGWKAPAPPSQPSLWGNASVQPPQQQQSLFTTSDVWGTQSAVAATGDLFGTSAGMQKKDDAFGDIWGGFK